MKIRKLFIHGLLAGILSSIVCFVYFKVYEFALAVDYAMVITPIRILLASICGTLLASLGKFFLSRIIKSNLNITFNFILFILTCFSIIAPLLYSLPLEVDLPELFPGLVIPMHFFPALSWLTLSPLFRSK